MSTPSDWRALLASGAFDTQALRLPAGSVVDLRGADLQGLDLRNMGIFAWDLSAADLRGATFEENFIARCRIQGARFDAPPDRLAAILDLWSGNVSGTSTFSFVICTLRYDCLWVANAFSLFAIVFSSIWCVCAQARYSAKSDRLSLWPSSSKSMLMRSGA